MRAVKVMVVLISIWCSVAVAREVAGADIPEQAMVDGTSLILNGTGIREKFFIKVYAAGLYLPVKNNDAVAIESGAMQKRIIMHFVYSEVSKKKINSGWWDGFKGNTSDEQLTALKPRLVKFQGLFEDMVEGDIILLDMLPGQGTRVTINGNVKGLIEGDDFSTTLVRVWLGPDPVGGALKKGLLGK